MTEIERTERRYKITATLLWTGIALIATDLFLISDTDRASTSGVGFFISTAGSVLGFLGLPSIYYRRMLAILRKQAR